MEPRKILVPVDGSGFSGQALRAVRELFDPGRCHVTLLRVGSAPAAITTPNPPTYVPDGWSGLLQDFRSDAARDLARHPVIQSQVWDGVRNELLDSMAADLEALRKDGFRTSAAVRFGDPATEIVDFAEAGRFDLVAMATHGRTGLQRALMGSVAQSVLSRSRTRVMLLHGPRLPATESDALDRSAGPPVAR